MVTVNPNKDQLKNQQIYYVLKSTLNHLDKKEQTLICNLLRMNSNYH